jgi:hypothetical protein
MSVYRTEGGLHIRSDNSVALSTIGRATKPIDYVCGDCGYWERHIPPGRMLEKIKATWPLVPSPRRQSPSAGPQDAVPHIVPGMDD